MSCRISTKEIEFSFASLFGAQGYFHDCKTHEIGWEDAELKPKECPIWRLRRNEHKD